MFTEIRLQQVNDYQQHLRDNAATRRLGRLASSRTPASSATPLPATVRLIQRLVGALA